MKVSATRTMTPLTNRAIAIDESVFSSLSSSRASFSDESEAGPPAAVAKAAPLSQNEYKVQLARVAVKRAILTAGGLETGGF